MHECNKNVRALLFMSFEGNKMNLRGRMSWARSLLNSHTRWLQLLDSWQIEHKGILNCIFLGIS